MRPKTCRRRTARTRAGRTQGRQEARQEKGAGGVRVHKHTEHRHLWSNVPQSKSPQHTYCTVLYCAVLYCTVLYCTVPHTVPHCCTSHCTSNCTSPVHARSARLLHLAAHVVGAAHLKQSPLSLLPGSRRDRGHLIRGFLLRRGREGGRRKRGTRFASERDIDRHESRQAGRQAGRAKRNTRCWLV